MDAEAILQIFREPNVGLFGVAVASEHVDIKHAACRFLGWPAIRSRANRFTAILRPAGFGWHGRLQWNHGAGPVCEDEGRRMPSVALAQEGLRLGDEARVVSHGTAHPSPYGLRMARPVAVKLRDWYGVRK